MRANQTEFPSAKCDDLTVCEPSQPDSIEKESSTNLFSSKQLEMNPEATTPTTETLINENTSIAQRTKSKKPKAIVYDDSILSRTKKGVGKKNTKKKNTIEKNLEKLLQSIPSNSENSNPKPVEEEIATVSPKKSLDKTSTKTKRKDKVQNKSTIGVDTTSVRQTRSKTRSLECNKTIQNEGKQDLASRAYIC